jgi:hypothetical protein
VNDTQVVRITIYGDKGTRYSWLERPRLNDEWEIEHFSERYPHGEWNIPFKNADPAYGITETLGQDEKCPPFIWYEDIIRVTITDSEGYF